MTIVANDTEDRNPPWVNHTIEYIKKYGEGGISGSMVKRPDVSSLEDWDNVRKELMDNPNTTQLGIVFCLDSSQLLSQFFCYST